MKGHIILNFEVKGFSESVKSKNKTELSPIRIYSKNKVSNSNLLTYHKLFLY